MKTIGFIDHFIDEWHANNYPNWIRSSSFKDRYDVALAWAETDPPGKKTLDDWCREQRVKKASSLREVVKTCDAIVVLSPDNPERHEALSNLPLRSGKPVYIDKPFAPTVNAAKRLFAKAQKFHTPVMSCSALRYAEPVDKAFAEKVAGAPVRYVTTIGGGRFEVYAIHQVEMLVKAIGTGAVRVKQVGDARVPVVVIEYADERRGLIQLLPGYGFHLSAHYGDGKSVAVPSMGDFFPRFIEGMLDFFETKQSPVPPEQTLEIAAIVQAGTKALTRPDRWVRVGSR